MVDSNNYPNSISKPTIEAEGLSIVVPAFNEEGLIRGAVEHLVSVTAGLGCDTEIVIVNDGSSDATSLIIHELANQYDSVVAVDLEKNTGFGGAVRYGIGITKFPLVMFCPVDYRLTQRDLDIYLAIIRHCDVAIGYRRLRRIELPLYPRMVSTVYHSLVNFLFRLNFFDVNWIHVYRRRWLSHILGSSNGVFFLAETLIRANRLNLQIIGVDVPFSDRTAGVASGLRAQTILRTIGEMMHFYFSDEWRQR